MGASHRVGPSLERAWRPHVCLTHHLALGPQRSDLTFGADWHEMWMSWEDAASGWLLDDIAVRLHTFMTECGFTSQIVDWTEANPQLWNAPNDQAAPQ